MNIGTRKLIWSVPLVAVLAVAGALAIFAAQMPGIALAHDPPGVPGDVMAEAKGPRSIEVSWSAPSTGGAPTGYRIDRSGGGDDTSEGGNVWFTLVENTRSTDTEYLDAMKVEPGKRYYYRVFAINSAGTGPVAKDDFADAAAASAPDMPLNVVANAMGQNKVVLMWNPPAKDGGSPLDKYRIHIWSEGGTPADTGVPATEPTAATENTTPVPADATELTDGIVVVDHNGETTRQTYEHTKATAGTRYLYRVFAMNEVPLTSTGSDSEGAETAALTKPGAPTTLRAVQDTDATIQLYWYAPTDTGGADITGYRVSVATKLAGANFGTFADEDPGYTASASSAEDYEYDISGTLERVKFRVYSQTGDHTADPLPATALESTGYSEVTVTVRTEATRALRVHTAPVARTNPAVAIATRDNFGNVKVQWAAPESLADTTGPSTVSGYLIDVSDDAISWMALQSSTGRATAQYFYPDPEKMPKYYRILAWNGSQLGPALLSNPSTVPGETPGAPSAVRNLRVTPAGPTQINLTWQAPSNLGNAPIKRYNIHARMDITENGCTDWPAADAADGTGVAGAGTACMAEVFKTKDGMTTTYSHMDLKAGQTWQYRVLAVNQGAEANAAENVSADGAVEKSAKTAQESMPEMPEGLTAEDAKDASSGATADRGVLLQWNAPNPPDGATIAGYRIDRKVNDGEWATLEANTDSTYTAYTDEDEPKADEMRVYRVRAISANKVNGSWAMVYYPATAQAHVPSKPTAVTATKDADMPASKIKVSWSAPAMNAGSVDGYIIERRYGDMMMDITGYSGTDGANRNHAFKNYKEWWETLNCDGMLQAANIAPADATDEQKGMYCKHFLATAPSMVADTDANADKKISDETAMKVKDLFMKRYVTDDMGKTMTMFTGMMYTDMGLMENTEYTYRVRAFHGMTASMWSDKDMETTDAVIPSTLRAPVVTATEGAGSVTLNWDDQAAAVEYTVWAVRSDALPVRVGNDARFIKDADITGREHTVEMLISGVEYWFAVTACAVEDCDNADSSEYIHSAAVRGITPR